MFSSYVKHGFESRCMSFDRLFELHYMFLVVGHLLLNTFLGLQEGKVAPNELTYLKVALFFYG
jgi:hypothetical protein